MEIHSRETMRLLSQPGVREAIERLVDGKTTKERIEMDGRVFILRRPR